MSRIYIIQIYFQTTILGKSYFCFFFLLEAVAISILLSDRLGFYDYMSRNFHSRLTVAQTIALHKRGKLHTKSYTIWFTHVCSRLHRLFLDEKSIACLLILGTKNGSHACTSRLLLNSWKYFVIQSLPVHHFLPTRILFADDRVFAVTLFLSSMKRMVLLANCPLTI